MKSSPPQTGLKVLHLEDNRYDQELVREMLAAEGLNLQLDHATTPAEFQQALQDAAYDLIISDFTLPSYDGQAALAAARAAQPEAAFIFFSGTIGEEIAVESLKTGATDYVLKQRPHRLVSAVRRALEETGERRLRRAAQAALREAEERFRIVARATNDVIWDWNLQTNEVWRNENFTHAFGYPPAATVGQFAAWTELLHAEDRPALLASLSGVIATGGKLWSGEYRLRRADGQYAYVFDRASVMYDDQGRPLRMIGVMIDVTERRQAEEKVREQAALLQKAQDAVIVSDLEGRIGFWNPSAERVYGWRADEVLGQSVEQLLFPALGPQYAEACARLLRDGEWRGEVQQADRQGRPVTALNSWTLVRDELGRPKSRLMISTDLTSERHLAEQLIRAQRAESLGVLISGITHDLNNSLAPILMCTGFLETTPLSAEAAELVKTIAASARRGADMVSQVLSFARGRGVTKSPVRVDLLVKEVGKIIAETFPRNIRCRVQTGPDCWLVTAAATQLHQVLMNLCLNARDAMPRGGELVIATHNVSLSAAQAAARPGASAGKFLCLAVSDTGGGIAPERLPQIFQPFFTTKPPGKGTGLGLSTSRTIVEQHGGFLGVESTVGRGTKFEVFLPAGETAAAPAALPPGNDELVLVVDDELAVLTVVEAALHNYNYRVLTAASGPQALAIFSEHREHVRVVITDMVMPLMDGAATIAGLRQIRPDVTIIATTGLEETEATRRLQPHAFIPKPLTVEKLLHALHRVLTAAPPPPPTSPTPTTPGK